MASNTNVYVNTLFLYYINPHRHLIFAELQNLFASLLDTLLPHYSILIGKTKNNSVALNNGTTEVMVDGVRISYPNIFVGLRILVHRIDDVLVTGLNCILKISMKANKNSLGVTTTPAAALGNSPMEFLAPMAQFDWNIAVPPPKRNLTPIPQFDSGNLVMS
ncbi:FAS1 domain-containing protein [Abeliophyllum distichum]|uniref:FAS1 domain-containing protein n=1 Tax=Abeliophyllum distichum TaxID=126358 RepID=A0ABD1RH73_9LAMI